VQKARQLMEAGKLSEAYLAASAAVTLNEKRWEAYAVMAMVLGAQGNELEAKRQVEKAISLAPSDKQPTLAELRNRLSRGTNVSRDSAVASAPNHAGGPDAGVRVPPSGMNAETRRRLDALTLIIKDADRAPTSAERMTLLREFMTKSEPFVEQVAGESSVWMLRAGIAVELGYPIS